MQNYGAEEPNLLLARVYFLAGPASIPIRQNTSGGPRKSQLFALVVSEKHGELKKTTH